MSGRKIDSSPVNYVEVRVGEAYGGGFAVELAFSSGPHANLRSVVALDQVTAIRALASDLNQAAADMALRQIEAQS